MSTLRHALGALTAVVSLGWPVASHAAGLEIPDNGAEALGRGGAFAAKADDPTAIQYNVAGLAAQRGTSVLLDAKVSLDHFSFRRAGVYPGDPSDPATPWAGRPYPTVVNRAAPVPAPFVAVTTDFGLSKRLTLGAGLFGPSAGARTFPLTVGGAPGPARYDLVQSKGVLAYPTLAAGYRVFDALDVGVAVHGVVASVQGLSVASIDVSREVCKSPEYQPCDAHSRLDTSGATVTGAVGLMVRPSSNIAVGLAVRGPATLSTEGLVTVSSPTTMAIPLEPSNVTMTTRLPWVARLGVRALARQGDFETRDIELDVTYEAWALAHGDGVAVAIPRLGPATNLRSTLVHHYDDAYSLRLGGSTNHRIGDHVLSLRAGGFYDATTTRNPWTRVDVDTLDKLALTVGASYSTGVFRFTAALAEVFEIERVVRDGRIQATNGVQGASTTSATGEPMPIINNGTYSGHQHVFAFGVEASFGKTSP